MLCAKKFLKSIITGRLIFYDAEMNAFTGIANSVTWDLLNS